MSITPYLCVPDSRAALDWYETVLGAQRAGDPIVMEDGRVGHCELTIGGAKVFMADEFPEVGAEAPLTDRGAAVSLMVQVPDCDAVAERAAAGGARITRGPEDNESTGRAVVFRDPFGHRWFVTTPTTG